jgi:hypothetical protein
MIDTRYPPQPTKTVVPLYPLHGSLRSFVDTLCFQSKGNVSILRSRIGEYFRLSADACFLAHSARYVLCHFVRWLQQSKGRQLVVAVPSFYCSHTAVELLRAGVRLVFVDIDENFALAPNTEHILEAGSADILIAPDLFVSAHWDANRMRRLSDRGVLVIHDRAQSFPIPVSRGPPLGVATLLSFGASKPLAGVGGGGLLVADEALRAGFFEYYKRLDEETVGRPTWESGMTTWRAMLRRHWPVAAVKLGLVAPLFSDQRAHLQRIVRKPALFPHDNLRSLTPLQAAVALDNWNLMEAVWDAHLTWQGGIIEAVGDALGDRAVRHLRTARHVSVVALRVPSRLRHQLASAAAAAGWQTTWYYFPLHRLDAFAGSRSHPLPGTDRAAAEVLVLPCHWAHSFRSEPPDISTLWKGLRCASKP